MRIENLLKSSFRLGSKMATQSRLNGCKHSEAAKLGENLLKIEKKTFQNLSFSAVGEAFLVFF